METYYFLNLLLHWISFWGALHSSHLLPFCFKLPLHLTLTSQPSIPFMVMFSLILLELVDVFISRPKPWMMIFGTRSETHCCKLTNADTYLYFILSQRKLYCITKTWFLLHIHFCSAMIVLWGCTSTCCFDGGGVWVCEYWSILLTGFILHDDWLFATYEVNDLLPPRSLRILTKD